MKPLIFLALAAMAHTGCETAQQKAAQARSKMILQQTIREANLERQRAEREQAEKQRAIAEQRARDWAALTPQQRMEWELRTRELQAARLRRSQSAYEAERIRRALDDQRSDAAFNEINEYYDNRRREQQAQETTRALDDIATELRRRR